MVFFLEKNNDYIIIYSKVSNFKVYKGGFDNVCWKRKRIKGISWLQKEYGIGFKLAKEIYFDSLKNNDSDK